MSLFILNDFLFLQCKSLYDSLLPINVTAYNLWRLTYGMRLKILQTKKQKNEWYVPSRCWVLSENLICLCIYLSVSSLIFFSLSLVILLLLLLLVVDYLSKCINLDAYVRNTLASVVQTPNNAQLFKNRCLEHFRFRCV